LPKALFPGTVYSFSPDKSMTFRAEKNRKQHREAGTAPHADRPHRLPGILMKKDNQLTFYKSAL